MMYVYSRHSNREIAGKGKTGATACIIFEESKEQQPAVSSTIQGKWALVTGASSGLGVDFARELATRECNLILVARRKERLETIQQELSTQYGVDVHILPLDLAAQDAPQQLYNKIQQEGRTVDILVNNAGFGAYGPFLEIPWEHEQNMLELDILTVVHICKLFARDMVAQRSGYMLQIASIGAYQPTPTYASYAAAKSFVLYFSIALNQELRNTGVSSTVLSPGITATEFLQVAGQQRTLYQRMMMMQSADVARIGIRAMLKRKPEVVPGWLNSFSALLTRIFPRSFSAVIAQQMMTR
jgi:hypothetical protein